MSNYKSAKAADVLREEFPALLDEAFGERFGKEVETSWNIFAGPAGGLLTVTKDDVEMTVQERFWLDGFSAAVNWAVDRLRDGKP